MPKKIPGITRGFNIMMTKFTPTQLQFRKGGIRYRIIMRRVSGEIIKYQGGNDEELGDYDTFYNQNHYSLSLSRIAELTQNLRNAGYEEENFWK